MPSSHSKQQLQDYTSSMQLGKEVTVHNDVNKSTASLMNLSTIHGKRRSNSTLDEYFKQKFGSPAKDVLFGLFRSRPYRRNYEFCGL